MTNQRWDTDEDRMIHKLTVHKNLITWVIQQLEKENIPCQRTTGNDPNGDILVINPEQAPSVKEIIRGINRQFNG
ncbi:hypothetical protein J0895_10440 [Phormidium pseudopriestleyi FRX01]|uniref:Uncharacterized protein n=1 Tax=Phormidium pseudopriestleyi FRX01 TaxID=1759528 RepID=A0ABS3FQW8_9CYAN|nr:hypothetical protein [Phormidium pseudopriestleyi]MBO0349519.1 hypothetical protein [Phormidium pseudopriestleyi FRX01]